jgi:hypothetical protein
VSFRSGADLCAGAAPSTGGVGSPTLGLGSLWNASFRQGNSMKFVCGLRCFDIYVDLVSNRDIHGHVIADMF